MADIQFGVNFHAAGNADEPGGGPFVLHARNAGEAAAELRRQHELYGFDSGTTHQPSMEALGQVIAAYRGR